MGPNLSLCWKSVHVHWLLVVSLWSHTTALFWCGCDSLYKFPGDVINVQLVRILLSLATFYGVSIQGDTASPIYFTLWAYRDLVVATAPFHFSTLCSVIIQMWAYGVMLPLPSILYNLSIQGDTASPIYTLHFEHINCSPQCEHIE